MSTARFLAAGVAAMVPVLTVASSASAGTHAPASGAHTPGHVSHDAFHDAFHDAVQKVPTAPWTLVDGSDRGWPENTWHYAVHTAEGDQKAFFAGGDFHGSGAELVSRLLFGLPWQQGLEDSHVGWPALGYHLVY